MQTTTSVPMPHSGEHMYDEFLGRVERRFQAITEPLFTTDATGLFEAFLSALPPGRRQHYTCRNCQNFIERFGGLVTIGENGEETSAFWDIRETPTFFLHSIEAMFRIIHFSKVTGVFLSSDKEWGRGSTPGKDCVWHHFSVKPKSHLLFKHPLLNADQMMAEKREDHHNVARALHEYTKPVVDEALRVLRSDVLYRSEKVIGPAEWLAKLHADREMVKGGRKDNILWRAVATAPAGFCHPRSSMIGTLLDDIVAGLPFADVSRKFKEKMNPTKYQRPTAAPTAGAIAQAEKVVSQLAIEGALARRYAKLEDIETIWKPKVMKNEQPSGTGVFGHLKPKGHRPTAPQLQLPQTNMTWEKFARTVLPTAEKIEFFTRDVQAGYIAMVTAVNPDAPPILQWDREDRRNTVSTYVYKMGSYPREWCLKENTWHQVTAIAEQPSQWGDKPLAHHGKGVIFIIEGAKDTREAGAALFPEILRSELHGVRKVIESYSSTAKIEGREEATACGISVHSGSGRYGFRFRVTSGGGTQEYVLDRWD